MRTTWTQFVLTSLLIIHFAVAFAKCQGLNVSSNYAVPTPVLQGCGNVFTGIAGVITSPNYPGSYPSNTHCKWEITVQSRKVIFFEFEDLEIEVDEECSYDSLQVQEQVGSKFKTIARFCGTKLPSAFRTQSNFAKVIFTTDDSENKKGFKLKWKVVSEELDCGKTEFNATEGSLSSPGFPGSYGNNMNCSYHLYARKGYQLLVRINHLDMEYGNSCEYDNLQIYDVRSTGKLLFGKFCGTKPPKNDMISRGQHILINFKSDESTNGRGFNVSWTSKRIPVEKGNWTCGRKYHSLRIVGGTIANKGEFPWQAGFFWRTGIAKGKFFCGGTLINYQWILTAAHCFVNGKNESLYKVVLGNHNLRTFDGQEQELNISEIIIHASYDMTTYDYDIALVKLEKKAKLDDFINTLCLPGHVPRAGTRCMVAGWGATVEHGRASDLLMKAEVPIIGANICRHPDVYGTKITNNMMCAGYPHGGIDTCQGDSGSSLHCQSQGDPNKWEVQGIASWGRGCGRQMRYGVYTKVGNFLHWINCVLDSSSEIKSVSDRVKHQRSCEVNSTQHSDSTSSSTPQSNSTKVQTVVLATTEMEFATSGVVAEWHSPTIVGSLVLQTYELSKTIALMNKTKVITAETRVMSKMKPETNPSPTYSLEMASFRRVPNTQTEPRFSSNRDVLIESIEPSYALKSSIETAFSKTNSTESSELSTENMLSLRQLKTIKSLSSLGASTHVIGRSSGKSYATSQTSEQTSLEPYLTDSKTTAVSWMMTNENKSTLDHLTKYLAQKTAESSANIVTKSPYNVSNYFLLTASHRVVSKTINWTSTLLTPTKSSHNQTVGPATTARESRRNTEYPKTKSSGNILSPIMILTFSILFIEHRINL